MKNLIHLSFVLLAAGTISCTEEAADVVYNEPIVQRTNTVLDFSTNNQINEDIDIDSDGTIDFKMIGYRGVFPDEPELGNMTMIRLMPTVEGNEVASAGAEILNVCGMNMEYYPVPNTMSISTIGSEEFEWSTISLLYVHMINTGDCAHYVRHYENDTDNTVAFRFLSNGELHYGWITLGTEDLTPSGCPELAEKWTIREYGYGTTANAPVTIPK